MSDVYPCNVCGEPAVACLRPDMDVKGLCFCDKHREEVYAVYMLILSLDEDDLVDGLIKDWKFK